MKQKMPRELLLIEFEHTRQRHGGRLTLAAPVLGMSVSALSRALYRARADGVAVSFHDDIKRLQREGAA